MAREVFVVRDAVDVGVLVRAVRRRVWEGVGGVDSVERSGASGRAGRGRRGTGGSGVSAAGAGAGEEGEGGEVVLVDERYVSIPVCLLCFSTISLVGT